MSGTAVTTGSRRRGNPTGRVAATEGGRGGSDTGTRNSGGAKGCCGPRPGSEQDPFSAAGHRGATVSV